MTISVQEISEKLNVDESGIRFLLGVISGLSWKSKKLVKAKQCRSPFNLTVYFIFLSRVPAISPSPTIFKKISAIFATCLFRTQWHGHCLVEHWQRRTHPLQYLHHGDLGHVENLPRFPTFNHFHVHFSHGILGRRLLFQADHRIRHQLDNARLCSMPKTHWTLCGCTWRNQTRTWAEQRSKGECLERSSFYFRNV